MNGEAGKGSRYRRVNGERWRKNYDKIFCKKKEKKEKNKNDEI